MKPFLSICIPTFNRAASLEKCINSIIKQDSFIRSNSIEILVQDNSSSDNTSKICAYYKDKLGDKFQYFKNDRNVGPIQNITYALLNSNGVYRKLNNDTLIHMDNSLDKIYNEIKNTNKDQLVLFKRDVCNTPIISNNLPHLLKTMGNDITWIGSFGIWESDLYFLSEIDLFEENLITNFIVQLFLKKQTCKIITLNNQYKIDNVKIKGGYDYSYVFIEYYTSLIYKYKNDRIVNNYQYHQILCQHIVSFLLPWHFRFILNPNKWQWSYNWASYSYLFTRVPLLSPLTILLCLLRLLNQYQNKFIKILS